MATFVLATEAMLSFTFHTAGIETPDQLPGRNTPHEERRRIEENRRETSFSQRSLSGDHYTL